MIGHHQEVERPGEFRRLTAGGRHLFAAGKAVGITRLKPAAEHAGIHGEAGVQMGVAEQRPRREFAVGIRGVRLLTKRLVDLFFVNFTRGETREFSANAGTVNRTTVRPTINSDCNFIPTSLFIYFNLEPLILYPPLAD